ncbi:MAG: hypothetical protein NZ959_11545 [Armatimonadetes bacterium]|nr:hypothetical protein [Armatimonadota bacterium]MDW8121266.1 hypothetical protein [Armatimonadota bacterium]
MRGDRSKGNWIAISALVLLSLVPHRSFILSGEYPLPEGYLRLLSPNADVRPLPWNALWWDAIGQFWAWHTEAQRQREHNFLPLWSARIGNGFPFASNPQTQTFYPPRWILSFFFYPVKTDPEDRPITAGFLLSVLALFHTFLATAGTYWLLVSIGRAPVASVIGACSYGLGSFQMAWALLPTLPATAAWLPVCCAIAVTLSRSESGWLWVAPLAFSWSCLLLAGHTQVAAYATVGFLFFSVCFYLCRRVKGNAYLALAMGLIVGFLIASPQLLSLAHLHPLTHRAMPVTAETLQALSQRAMSLSDWLTLLAPYLFGNPIRGTYFGKEAYADFTAYSGLSILLLAGLAFLSGTSSLLRRSERQDPLVRSAFLSFLVMALVGWSLSSLPLSHQLLSHLHPGFGQFGTPSRALFLVQLGCAGLAALGWDDLYRRQRPWFPLLIALAPLLLFIALPHLLDQRPFSVTRTPFEWERILSDNQGIVLGWAAFFCALLTTLPVLHRLIRKEVLLSGALCLIVGELVWFSASQIPTARPRAIAEALKEARKILPIVSSDETGPVRLLPLGLRWSLFSFPDSLIPPNALLLLEPFSDLRPYDSLLLRSHKALLAVFSDGNPCPPENGNMVLMPSNRSDPRAADRLGAHYLLTPSDQGFTIDPVFSPFAYLPDRVLFRPSDEEILQAVKDPTVAVLRGLRESVAMNGSVALNCARTDPVITVFLAEQHLEDKGRWLVIREQSYPGWKAFLSDGRSYRPLAVQVADFAFMSCWLPEKTTKVVFVFYPAPIIIGLFLSLTALSLLCAGISFWWWKWRTE